MKKTHLIIVNIILLLWYFLSMIGLKIGDKYLVTGAFEEEWLFMLIPTITFVLMLVTKTSHTQNGICTLKIQYFS